MPEIEGEGDAYFNINNQPQDALTIFKNNGFNVVRIRLWKNPSSYHSSFEEVKSFSQRVKNSGLKEWLSVIILILGRTHETKRNQSNGKVFLMKL